jgi:hypothetical protein
LKNDNNDNDERIIEDIIARGTNTVATYTDEDCSQADKFLNIIMIGAGGIAAKDLENNEDDIAANSENNEDHEDAKTEGSNKVYISCIKFISINLTPAIVFLIYCDMHLLVNE